MTTTAPATETAATEPKCSTWKGHGKPTEIWFWGPVAKWSEPVAATVKQDGQAVEVQSLTGGTLMWAGSAARFWAAPRARA